MNFLIRTVLAIHSCRTYHSLHIPTALTLPSYFYSSMSPPSSSHPPLTTIYLGARYSSSYREAHSSSSTAKRIPPPPPLLRSAPPLILRSATFSYREARSSPLTILEYLLGAISILYWDTCWGAVVDAWELGILDREL